MLEEYFIFPLYLFYGLAFFAMGVSITSRDTRSSNLTIARSLWLFALFAFTHAVLEWYSLYLILYSPVFPNTFLRPINFGKLALVFISFSFLLLFGLNVLSIVFPQKKVWIYTIYPLLVASVFIASRADLAGATSSQLSDIDLQIRHLIGFPGAAVAALALIFYSRTVEAISRRGALNFAGAGLSLACYGILAGLVPSGGSFPVVGGPIELYRGMSALVILYFVMHALYIFDIERKIQIEERLNRFAQSEKLHALGKLAFGIAHEINNPLSNVMLKVELLKSELQDLNHFGLYENKLDVIERNLLRASKIAKELLYFSTNKESDFQEVDVSDVVKSTLDLLGSRRNAYDIQLRFLADKPIPAIPWKLEEVFLNVILNAMEAMPDGGKITIETENSGERVLVRISDSGPGIPTQLQPYVLDPFFTTKEVGEGTGLGLSICFGIMELHQGSIEFAQSKEGGTTVVLDFPTGVARDV